MQQIVNEMGPVEGTNVEGTGAQGTRADSDASAGGRPDAGLHPPKRLYRIHKGRMFAGVCNGLAAYFGLDVVLVRVIFLVLIVITFGWGFFGYWILAKIIPEAYTSDERAAAHGQAPFNAQELIDQAKKTAADFKSSADFTSREWRRQWREQRRQWRSQHREWRRQWRAGVGNPRTWAPPAPSHPATRVALMMPIFSIVSLAFFIVFAMAMWSLITTGAIDGWALPAGMPLWAVSGGRV